MTALRIGLVALLTALRYPRVWLSLWAWVTAAALFVVVPVYRATEAALAQHPGATTRIDQALDTDLWRENADLTPHLTGASVFVLLGTVFFAGGILACLGVGKRFRFTTFLGECARLFPRNLRVLLVGFVPAVLLFWVVGFADSWLRESLLRNVNPGGPNLDSPLARLFSLEFALDLLNWFWGLVFLLLVFTAKVAMAHLALADGRSACLAWAKAARRVLTRPLLASLVIFVVGLAYVPLFFLGHVVTRFLEIQPNLWAGLACGQGAIMWLQVVTVAFFLAARRLLVATAPAVAEEAAAEPTVVLPRKEKAVPIPKPAPVPVPGQQKEPAAGSER